MPAAKVNPQSRAGILFGIYAHLDRIVEDHYRHLPEADHPPCGPGCSDCCGHIFLWTSLKLLCALHAFRALHPGSYQNLSYNSAKVTRQIGPKYPFLTATVDEWAARGGPFTGGELAAYSTKCAAVTDAPCLFLAGGRCSIYPWRPMVCRTYGAALVFLTSENNFSAPVCPLFMAKPALAQRLAILPEYPTLRNRVNTLGHGLPPLTLPLLTWFYGFQEVRNGDMLDRLYNSIFLADFTEEPPDAPDTKRAVV